MADHTYNLANDFYSQMMEVRRSRPPELNALSDALYAAEEKAKQYKIMLSPRRDDHEVWVALHQEAVTAVGQAKRALDAYQAEAAA